MDIFFINSLTSEEKANLVRESIVRLNEINVEVVCVTCDGAPNNVAMFSELGASTNVDNIISYFPHPCEPTKVVNVMLRHLSHVKANKKHIWNA